MKNYFNYFTEIEECYRRCRNTPSLLSPLDWALIESWKEAGIPLEAVLAGIERSFVKFRKRPARLQKINSLAYCTQLVLTAAQEMKDSGAAAPARGGMPDAAPPFSPEEIQEHFRRSAAALAKASNVAPESGQSVLSEDLRRVARDLIALAAQHAAEAMPDFRSLEQKLSALEDVLNAALVRASSMELLAGLKAEVDRSLARYRRNLPAAQIESVERQAMKKRLFEHYRVPRLSLFYL